MADLRELKCKGNTWVSVERSECVFSVLIWFCMVVLPGILITSFTLILRRQWLTHEHKMPLGIYRYCGCRAGHLPLPYS
jgi:hypothetical protein